MRNSDAVREPAHVMARPCAYEDNVEGARARGRKEEADNARGHDFEDARDRKRDREAASVRVGHAKTARACEGDIEVSGHAMMMPTPCAEATERPRALANVLVRPPVYVKDRCTIDCIEGCASANECGEEGSRAREQSGEKVHASDHHTVERLPGQMESKIQMCASVDGNSNGYKHAAGCSNGEGARAHEGVSEAVHVCEHRATDCANGGALG